MPQEDCGLSLFGTAHDQAALIKTGNSLPVFQSAKHDFDTIASLVSTFVILNRLLTVFATRDARLYRFVF